MTTHFVYEFYGENGPLYVGYTAQINKRLEDHRRKPWWSEITRLEANTYPDAHSGRMAERERIRVLDPIYNLEFTDRMPDGWQTRVTNSHAQGKLCGSKSCEECNAKLEARRVVRETFLYQRRKKTSGSVGGAAPTQQGEMR